MTQKRPLVNSLALQYVLWRRQWSLLTPFYFWPIIILSNSFSSFYFCWQCKLPIINFCLNKLVLYLLFVFLNIKQSLNTVRIYRWSERWINVLNYILKLEGLGDGVNFVFWSKFLKKLGRFLFWVIFYFFWAKNRKLIISGHILPVASIGFLSQCTWW